MNNKKQKTGFTLIELLITLAIIAILVCIVYPNYTNHLVKTRRTNVTIALLDLASRLEQYYAQNNSYQGASIENLGINDSGYKNYYQIKLSSDANTYSLHADPINSQIKADPECGSLSLDQNGTKNISGSGNIDECW